MAWTTPRTWSASVLTAAQLNTDIRDNMDWLATSKPMWSVFQSGNQSIPNATQTNLNYDSEEHDNNGLHSTVTNTNRVTITTSGKYMVGATGLWTTLAAGGYRVLYIIKNGSARRYNYGVVAPDNSSAMAISELVPCVAGDWLGIAALHNQGGALNITSVFWGFWVGF